MAPSFLLYLSLYLTTLATWWTLAKGSSIDTVELSLHRRPDLASLFRVGSGAVGYRSPRPAVPYEPNALPHARPKVPKDCMDSLIAYMPLISMFLICSTISCMMPGHHHGGGPPTLTARNDFSTKLPPVWCPEHERTYSFRRYMTDLQL